MKYLKSIFSGSILRSTFSSAQADLRTNGAKVRAKQPSLHTHWYV